MKRSNQKIEQKEHWIKLADKKYFDFLDLDAGASEEQIKQKIVDKFIFFKALIKNAPTQHLKMIYEKNIQQLNEITNILNLKIDLDEPVKFTNKTNDNQSLVALLIRHTEEKNIKTYKLNFGMNFIGRNKELNKNNIVLDDDDFISKQHAVIELQKQSLPSATVYDIGQFNGKFSTNGVFINGIPNRLDTKTELKDNDTIQIGYTKLIFKFSDLNNLKEVIDEVDATEYTKTVFIKIN